MSKRRVKDRIRMELPLIPEQSLVPLQDLATSLADASISAVASEISAALETRFTETHTSTLSKQADRIVIHKQAVIDKVSYEAIVTAALNAQLRTIFDTFHHTNQPFCTELATRVYAAVYDRQPADVTAEALGHLEAFIETSRVPTST
jgi:hypothetical protein